MQEVLILILARVGKGSRKILKPRRRDDTTDGEPPMNAEERRRKLGGRVIVGGYFFLSGDILPDMNIVLIGYRGSGKTAVGKLLAQKLGRAFVDTDELIVQRAGLIIKDIFAREGEAGFRQREAAAIAAACANDNQVIAAGGGAVLRAENVAAMKSNGNVIWLEADAAILHARIVADAATSANRPNLTSAGGIEEVRTLLAKRSPLYEAAADARVDVSQLAPQQVAERICQLIPTRIDE